MVCIKGDANILRAYGTLNAPEYVYRHSTQYLRSDKGWVPQFYLLPFKQRPDTVQRTIKSHTFFDWYVGPRSTRSSPLQGMAFMVIQSKFAGISVLLLFPTYNCQET